MKFSRIFLPTALVCLFAMGLFPTVSAGAAQEPQAAPAAGGPPMGGGPGAQGRRPPAPKPTNLKVLPKDLTGDQVRDIMRKWEGDLGAECNTCHDEYADHRKNERGQPQLDFAKDTKPEKEMARVMYKMTEDIKANQIQKVKDLDKDAADMNHPKPAELTCGTCHRGKVDPEAYIPPKRDNGPGGPGGPNGPSNPSMPNQGRPPMPGMQGAPMGF